MASMHVPARTHALPRARIYLSRVLAARRDASIGLATMQTDPSKWTKRSVAELSHSERDTLADWVNRFAAKYDVIGYLNDGANPKTVASAGGGR